MKIYRILMIPMLIFCFQAASDARGASSPWDSREGLRAEYKKFKLKPSTLQVPDGVGSVSRIYEFLHVNRHKLSPEMTKAVFQGKVWELSKTRKVTKAECAITGQIIYEDIVAKKDLAKVTEDLFANNTYFDPSRYTAAMTTLVNQLKQITPKKPIVTEHFPPRDLTFGSSTGPQEAKTRLQLFIRNNQDPGLDLYGAYLAPDRKWEESFDQKSRGGNPLGNLGYDTELVSFKESKRCSTSSDTPSAKVKISEACSKIRFWKETDPAKFPIVYDPDTYTLDISSSLTPSASPQKGKKSDSLGSPRRLTSSKSEDQFSEGDPDTFSSCSLGDPESPKKISKLGAYSTSASLCCLKIPPSTSPVDTRRSSFDFLPDFSSGPTSPKTPRPDLIKPHVERLSNIVVNLPLRHLNFLVPDKKRFIFKSTSEQSSTGDIAIVLYHLCRNSFFSDLQILLLNITLFEVSDEVNDELGKALVTLLTQTSLQEIHIYHKTPIKTKPLWLTMATTGGVLKGKTISLEPLK